VPIFVALGSAVLLGLSLLAFWPNYLSRPFAAADTYTHFHAAVGTAWLLLLVAQPLLIRAGHRKVHQTLGRLSYAMAPLFVVSGLLLAHYRFSRMEAAAFEQDAYTLYLPVSAALLFAVAYALAIAYRRSMRLHARFMACTGLLLLDPVLGRVLGFYVVELPRFWQYQLITFGLECSVLLALARTLPLRSPESRVFNRFAGSYAAVLALWFVVPHSSTWMSFARWFRHLSVT
jgi:hypothetical protein